MTRQRRSNNGMRAWVARNESVAAVILEVLSRDPDAGVRRCVAMKRKLPEAVQPRLAGGEDCSVRERLVYNARVTGAVLRVLADDAEPRIREGTREGMSRAGRSDAA